LLFEISETTTPEMLSDQKSVPASDLWQLGVIMFIMHVGMQPFIEDDY